MKIRIAVAVNSVGGYAALGAFGWSDAETSAATIKAITDTGTGAVAVHFIEADVPGPEQPAIIQGAVVSK